MNAATLARARKVASYTYGGRTFRCSAYTAASLARTVARLKKRHPKARLRIIQPSYNTGVKASAGTHNLDAAFDVEIIDMPGGWDAAVLFLRSCGWAAYIRTPAQGFSLHIHMVLIPPGLPANPTAAGVLAAFTAIGLKVGVFVPDQVDDYYNDALGLKGQHGYGTDRDPRPAGPISNYVFDFEAWERQMEDTMAGITKQDLVEAAERGAANAIKALRFEDPDQPGSSLNLETAVRRLLADGLPTKPATPSKGTSK